MPFRDDHEARRLALEAERKKSADLCRQRELLEEEAWRLEAALRRARLRRKSPMLAGGGGLALGFLLGAGTPGVTLAVLAVVAACALVYQTYCSWNSAQVLRRSEWVEDTSFVRVRVDPIAALDASLASEDDSALFARSASVRRAG
jgi:hypothetical protein